MNHDTPAIARQLHGRAIDVPVRHVHSRMTKAFLAERDVRLFVSKDTEALWEALALRMGLDSFDALVQVLCMYGAFLVASADLGYLEQLRLEDLGPDAIRAVVHPWLAARTGTSG